MTGQESECTAGPPKVKEGIKRMKLAGIFQLKVSRSDPFWFRHLAGARPLAIATLVCKLKKWVDSRTES